MPRRFDVETEEGRLTWSKGGTMPPNRISRFFSYLSNQWLAPGQRPHIQLPAPQGGWMRYALTLTPDTLYARCQDCSNRIVLERVYHATVKPDEKNLATRRVDTFFQAWNDTYRQGLERAYGWPRGHGYLPDHLPNGDGKTLMEALYMRYGTVSLVLSQHQLLLTSWGIGQNRTSGYGSQNTDPCTNRSYGLMHLYRWRGLTDEHLVETPALLQQAAKVLSATWSLTGTEGE